MSTHSLIAELRDRNRRGIPGVIVLLDVSNAFGSLPHALLFALMERMGFHPDML